MSYSAESMFLVNNFGKFSQVVSKVPSDSQHVQKLLSLFTNRQSLAANLTFINSHLAFLLTANGD